MKKYLFRALAVLCFLLAAYFLTGFFLGDQGDQKEKFFSSFGAILTIIGGTFFWKISRKQLTTNNKIFRWVVLSLISIFCSWFWIMMIGFALGGLNTVPNQPRAFGIEAVLGIIGLLGFIVFIYVVPRILYNKIVKGK